jgi:hypothetical protein
MTHRRLLVRLALALLVVLVVAAPVAWYVRHPRPAHAFLVGFSGLPRVDDDVYVDPAMTEAERQSVRGMQAQARARVTAMFGSIQSRPVVIAIVTPELVARYGSSTKGTALTYLTWWRSYIVLGPNGRNVDVLAHEMTHVELRERVRGGLFNLDAVVPMWFNEGLAMQNDARPEYSHAVFDRMAARGVVPPALADLATVESFRSGGADRVRMAYMVSKFEVERWLAGGGRARLLRLLEGLDTREAFEKRYRAAMSPPPDTRSSAASSIRSSARFESTRRPSALSSGSRTPAQSRKKDGLSANDRRCSR